MITRNKTFLLIAGLPALILIFAVALYFSASMLLDSSFVKGKLQTYILEKTGDSVAYRDSELHLFPLPEITFHQVKISIPGKAQGSVESLRIYPGLGSLLKGRVTISQLSLEAPNFTVTITEDREKTSLEQIEEKIRSTVHYVVSKTPGLLIVIQDGKLDLTEEDRTAFSFDLVQSRLSASENTVDIELTGRSDLWDNLSISSSIKADDLKSKGTIRFTHLRPDILITRLFKETGGQQGVTDADLSVDFEALGLREVKTSIESSVPELAISRGKRRVSLGETKIKGDIDIGPGAMSVLIKEAKISSPDLNLSGQYTLDRNSGIMTFALESKEIAVQPVRESALALGGDIPLIETIFDILQGGEIPALHVHTSGKSLTDLGRMENIRISGNMRGGTIHVADPDLTFQDVTGDVLISQGVLEGSNVTGSLDNHRSSGGALRIGLTGKKGPFHIDMRVKADVGQLPSLLKDKHLVKNEAVLREIDRLRDLRGSAEGRLILGERLDAVHVKIDVDDMDIETLYEPLPFPLVITGGKFFFDEKMVEIAGMAGSLGSSSFSRLKARLNLTDPYDLEMTDGQLSISADEIYPWIASFEEIRPVLEDVRSVTGAVSVSSLNLRGPLYQPKEWDFNVTGGLKDFAVDTTLLPGKAEGMNGTFGMTHNELDLKNIRFNILDSLVTLSGVIGEYPSDTRSMDISLKGEIGQKIASWIAELVHLPSVLQMRTPFSVTDAAISLDKDGNKTFTGRLVFGQGTQLSLSMTKTPDTLSVREVTMKDGTSDLAASIVLNKETVDAAFKGKVTSQTLSAIFTDKRLSDASLEGDFRTHIVIKQPRQSHAEGRLKGENIPIPGDRDIPLIVRHIELEAREQGVVIERSELSAGEMTFRAKGKVTNSPAWFAVDIDLSSNGIVWETFENMLRSRGSEDHKGDAGSFKDFPVRGDIRLRSDFFQYEQFRLEPFDADISFDGETVVITAKKAALCNVSTTGSVSIKEEGLKIDIALSAKDLAFEPTLLCLTDKQTVYTGIFQMEAHLKGEGKIGEIADRLDGTFTLSSKDGKILKSKSLDTTLDLLNESDNFRGQFPDLEREMISYTALKVSGSIREHRIQIEQGALDTSIMGIIARGHIDLYNKTFDINALLAPMKMVSRIIKKTPVVGYILGGNLTAIPVRISGDIKNPQVTFLSPSAVGSEFLGIVERTIKLPVHLVTPIFPARKKE